MGFLMEASVLLSSAQFANAEQAGLSASLFISNST
jgi:hypothetical protein